MADKIGKSLGIAHLIATKSKLPPLVVDAYAKLKSNAFTKDWFPGMAKPHEFTQGDPDAAGAYEPYPYYGEPTGEKRDTTFNQDGGIRWISISPLYDPSKERRSAISLDYPRDAMNSESYGEYSYGYPGQPKPNSVAAHEVGHDVPYTSFSNPNEMEKRIESLKEGNLDTLFYIYKKLLSNPKENKRREGVINIDNERMTDIVGWGLQKYPFLNRQQKDSILNMAYLPNNTSFIKGDTATRDQLKDEAYLRSLLAAALYYESPWGRQSKKDEKTGRIPKMATNYRQPINKPLVIIQSSAKKDKQKKKGGK